MSAAAEWSLAWVICRASEGKAVAFSLGVTTALELSLEPRLWMEAFGLVLVLALDSLLNKSPKGLG